ncbi:hypothetical protein PJP07_31240, partial [Mycobacterium kansasii]
ENSTNQKFVPVIVGAYHGFLTMSFMTSEIVGYRKEGKLIHGLDCLISMFSHGSLTLSGP